jgi:hypothetical protein
MKEGYRQASAQRWRSEERKGREKKVSRWVRRGHKSLYWDGRPRGRTASWVVSSVFGLVLVLAQRAGTVLYQMVLADWGEYRMFLA